MAQSSTIFQELDNHNDIELNKPAKARFLFLLFFLGFFIFMGGCSYALWSFKYRTTATQEVPESTSYNPKYK
jgi:cytoskeletal protein RodZ